MTQFSNQRKIRVMVVDDSMFFRKVLIDRISQSPNIEVVGSAVDPMDAMQKIPTLLPDVLTLDVEMPKMTGIEFLKHLLPKYSIPVVLVSSLNINVFDALSAGAIDFVRKPDLNSPGSIEHFTSDLLSKITIASASKVKNAVPKTPTTAARPTPEGVSPAVAALSQISKSGAPTKPLGSSSQTFSPGSLIALKASPRTDNLIIAIGASTGGTEATLEVLKNLPANTPGVLIVQHMPPGFTKMYAERLDRLCPMNVKEAKTGDKIVRGQALLAPGDAHMTLVKIGNEYSVKCISGEKVSGHCPSVDVLFDSVAKIAKNNAVGIIMTGMGRDGAEGLLNMRKQGAYTIGQDEASCVVYGMPMVAHNIGAVTSQVSCSNIAGNLKNYLNKL